MLLSCGSPRPEVYETKIASGSRDGAKSVNYIPAKEISKVDLHPVEYVTMNGKKMHRIVMRTEKK